MKILFCGGGALGSHALLLARDIVRDQEVSVIDFDRVKTRNLASQWFVKQMVGKPKATALKLQLLNFYGVALDRVHTVKLTKLNAEPLLRDFDLLVDCFDNAAARELVQRHARVHDVSCIHAGLAANGEFAAIRWDADFVIDAEDVPGQPTCEGDGFLPVIASACAALVQSLQAFIADREVQLHWNVSASGSEAFA